MTARPGDATTDPTETSMVIDARDAVICSWIFDLDQGIAAPFGFELVTVYRDDASAHLAALLRTTGSSGEVEHRLVNRGTRVGTGSVGAFFSASTRELSASLRIALGQAHIAMVEAAIRAGAAARRQAGNGKLLFLGQSPGGALAEVQAVADHRSGFGGRFVTFAASDAARLIAARFGPGSLSLPIGLGDNRVSPRDGLTGPGALFGPPLIGRRQLVPVMRGPRLVAWPGLTFHRARAWVSHCAGERADAAPWPYPRSAADWRALRGQGCIAPEGWPALR